MMLFVAGALFAGLPKEEKHLWHSHVHEVRSGSLSKGLVMQLRLEQGAQPLNTSWRSDPWFNPQEDIASAPA